MGNGAWSNDQLNQIFVYDATTGTLILRIDSTGLYYYNVANQSFFKVTGAPNDSTNTVSAQFGPGVSSVASVSYAVPGLIVGGENVFSPTSVAGKMYLVSPRISHTNIGANINLISQSNLSAVDDSQIDLYAAFLFGKNGNQIGQGTVDSGANYATASYTGTEIVADYCSEAVGVMSTTRVYEGRWTGVLQSSVAGDKIGLRIYTNASKTSLTGAVQIIDYGSITIAAANTSQPFFVDTSIVGVPGKFLLLGARRISGTGTCQMLIGQRKLSDISGS